jgi:outer membrane protein assembly factor BamB
VASVIEEPEPDAPTELPPGVWEAPPVRRGDLAAQIPELAAPIQATVVGERKRNIYSWITGGAVILVVIVVALAGYAAWMRNTNARNILEAQAYQNYKDGLYGPAFGDFEKLQKDYPDDEKYAFMVDLCRIRKAESELTVEPVKALEELASFLRQNDKNPNMQEYLRGVGETYVKVVRNRVIARITDRPDPAMNDAIVASERALAEFHDELAAGVNPADRADITGEFTRVREIIAREEQRQKDLVILRQLRPTQDGIVTGERLRREFGLQKDEDAGKIIEELYQQHIQTVKWTKEPAEKLTTGRADEVESMPTLLVAPVTQGVPPNLPKEEGTVFALVRGVLYALRQHDGAVEWAMRVGIDTTALPVRVPATPSSPEMILVISADNYTVRALDMSGRQIWKYQLTGPSLGRPVIINKTRAFFSTFDGQIHEIELAKGSLLGRYTLGEGVKLVGGGVHWQGTNLVFFPADEFCIYVMDVEEHVCRTILYTKHRSGSLRGEPIVAGWKGKSENGQDIPLGYLFINLTESLDSMKLRAYALPIDNPRGDPLPMNPEPKMRGWIWFRPHQDAEKVVQVTDAGKLALVGVKQQRNEDNPLFLLVPPNPKEKELGQGLERLLRPEPFELAERSRSLIAYAAEPDNFWVLAFGRLMRMKLLLAAMSGPVVRNAWEWEKPLSLGSPLHEAQPFEYPFEAGAEKSTTLMLVTEPLNREVCIATAVDANNGTIRWQRQLGLVSRGEPLSLGKTLIALDQGGSLSTFDASGTAGEKDQWLVGSRSIALSLDEGKTPPVLVAGPDGQSAYEFAIPIVPLDKRANLIIRVIQDRGGPQPMVQVKTKELREHLALAGKPAVNKKGILVPLSDGSILRFNLDGTYFAEGPSWKMRAQGEGDREDPETSTYITWLNDEEFVTVHGGRNMNRWRWKPGAFGGHDVIPAPNNENDPTIRMPANIVTEPVALPPDKDSGDVRLLVACEDRNVYLVEGRAADKVKAGEQGLKVIKHSNPKGKVTGGPFILGDRFLAIADRNRLLCFQPGERDPLWEYKSEGEAIVGRPQVVQDMLLLADQSGRFVGLDPKTGKLLGEGYTLKANVGPACSPVAFGKNQAFAPLTDGTILLLDLNQLRK